MSREAEAIRATTRAIAATVRDVPPLELEPGPGELWSPGRGPRHVRRGGSGRRALPWLAPVAAAAVVVAVAVALVLVRGPQNGGVVPQPALTGSGPGGVPRYYVALDRVWSKAGEANSLIVGDTVAGKTLRVITPPAHMSYQSVTAAADDRTFLAFATQAGGPWNAGRWYELRLAPGTAHLVSLTATAIGPQSTVLASALSASGRYLAVAEGGPARGQQRLLVFSVATGRPLRAWSTTTTTPMWAYSVTGQLNLLTWIDGDRAIAFAAYDEATSTQSVRRLNLYPPVSGGDLIADSLLIWTQARMPSSCPSLPPMVSADGRTIACARVSIKRLPTGQVQWTSTWRAYQASAQAPASGKSTIAYQFTRQEPGNAAGTMATLWISPAGSALIGEWAIAPGHQMTASPSSGGSASGTSATLPLGVVPAGAVHVGVISRGTFTPLALPQRILSLTPQAIAW